MHVLKLRLLACLIALFGSSNAIAWFIFIPGGAIQRAMETDPDSISVSFSDRSIAKCAGLHVNQGRKFSTNWGSPVGTDSLGNLSPGAVRAPSEESQETIFHLRIADLALAKATEKEKVRQLADAYSTRWGRVAGADQQMNRAYGMDLAKNCVQNDLPFRRVDLAAWEAKQEEGKRSQAEMARRELEAAHRRVAAEQEAYRARVAATAADAASSPAQASTPQVNAIDFGSEAKKSARILGCVTEDVRVVGTDGKNILFSARCPAGEVLSLSCDPSGLCLKK